MKEEMRIKNSCQKLLKNGFTMFLNEKETKQVKQELKKEAVSYSMFSLYEDCDKILFYKEVIPPLVLFEFTTLDAMEHRCVLGALFSLGIDEHTFGDIIVLENKCYVVTFPQVADVIEYQLKEIGKRKVKVKRVSFDVLNSYTRKYQDIKIKVPSLRIDAVLSKLTHLSRSQITEKIKQKEVLLNYEILLKLTKELKENDVFSMRKYGKYRFVKVTEQTKKQDFWIEIKKYQ